ncbi:MAG TPA: nicotinate-nucleotide adenylyltransferase [Methyloceanibacter sp.]|nr:nicotinate-nucleotide adenylyltransferase [Methyloceanibacter sp.]
MPKKKPTTKKIAKQAKPRKIKTAKALKPPKIKKPKKVGRAAKAKTSSKSAKSAKTTNAVKPARSSKPAKPSKLAKQSNKTDRTERKTKKAGQKADRKQEASLAKTERRERNEARPSKSLTPEEKAARLPMVSPRMRIGLLGGSFNPAHAAHVEISLTALKRLGLDQVWWIVTSGNPLKKPSTLPRLSERVEAARKIANHPRIAVTGFPGETGSPYTVDLLTELKRRHPAVSFVWLMGADNLAQVHQWRSWQKIFATVPIAVLDRPGFRLKARASQAATRFQEFHVDESDAQGLARMTPPAWTIITHRLSPLSSTAIRGEGKGKDKKSGKKR